jgi:hypothetical protein
MDDIEKEMLAYAFSSDTWKFKKCLDPYMHCDGQIIRAHTVQNSKILELLVRDGHVVSLKHRIDKVRGPVIKFQLVGRNEATTFTGICTDHDREIFKPIDKNEIDIEDPQHLFLLAYRPILRELHATMEGAIKIQRGYKKRVALGLDPKNQPSQAGMEAVTHMLKSWRTFRYKFEYDKVYLSKSYGSICHETRLLDVDRPTFAASVLFSGDTYDTATDIQCIALNVLPISAKRTFVVISWLPRDTAWVRQKFHNLLSSYGHYFRYLLSKTVLNYSENFVLSPSYFEAWPSEKRDAIRSYFIDTLMQSDLERENEYLYLF